MTNVAEDRPNSHARKDEYLPEQGHAKHCRSPVNEFFTFVQISTIADERTEPQNAAQSKNGQCRHGSGGQCLVKMPRKQWNTYQVKSRHRGEYDQVESSPFLKRR